RALVDARRQVPLRSDLLGYLAPQQHPAGPRLGALPDGNLDGVGPEEVVDVEAVAAGEHLVDQQPRGLPLRGEHASVAGGGGRAGPGGGAAQRRLGVPGERPVTHPGDGDRDLELDRPPGVPRAQHRPGDAALAVSLERYPRKRAGEEREVVEVRQRTGSERSEAAEPVAAELRLDLNVLDVLGRPDRAGPEHGRPTRRIAHSAARHTSNSCLLKLCSRPPLQTLVNRAGSPGSACSRSSAPRYFTSSPVIGRSTASLPSPPM